MNNDAEKDGLISNSLVQEKVEELLRTRIGLNPNSIGSRSILRAVNRGMRTGKMRGLVDYLNELQERPELFKALVESIVVPETSFFRNRASFVFLRQWISQAWTRGRVLRVLSVPCSTGEEPYSIAITLREEGLAMEDFHIDAVDISEQAIAKARQGVYSPYAFRRQNHRSNDKYFTLNVLDTEKKVQKIERSANMRREQRRRIQRYHLVESIKEKVNFLQGNLLSSGLLVHQPPYDIIFCRNLLIYFDREARKKTMAFFNRKLKPGGLLFVGYAETGLIDSEHYRAVPYPQTFAYYRREAAKADSLQDISSAATRSARSFNQKRKRPAEVAPVFGLPAPLAKDPLARNPLAKDLLTEDLPIGDLQIEDIKGSKSVCSPVAQELCSVLPRKLEISSNLVAPHCSAALAIAQQLADSGAVKKAAEQCDKYLAAFPTDAKAYLLRGELYQAMNELPEAEGCFRKAIYLSPQLYEALVHLMLLKEAQGDLDEATIIRNRIKRLEEIIL